MFCNKNYSNLLTNELIDIIFSILNLFFNSRKDAKYFLLGQNITIKIDIEKKSNFRLFKRIYLIYLILMKKKIRK